MIALHLERAREFLRAKSTESVRLGDAAAVAHLSQYHFHRLFTQAYGETPHHFVSRHRIDHAKALLASTDLPVTEVCTAVGFASLGTFSRRFTERCGRTPSAFRRDIRRSWVYVPRSWPEPRLWTPHFVPVCFAAGWLTSARSEKHTAVARP